MMDAAYDRHEFVAGLRELADFYDANPDLPIPWQGRISVTTFTRADMAAATRVLMRGAPCRKELDEYQVTVVRGFRGVQLRLHVHRSVVCTTTETSPGVMTTVCQPLLAPVVAA